MIISNLQYCDCFCVTSLVIHHSLFLLLSVTLLPSAYGLMPSATSFFFRLETLFLTFLALLYYIMNQLFIHPFYTNRPRFV